MASLKKRVERLERGSELRIPLIFVKSGETAEQAKEKHFAEYPEDKGAKTIIIIKGASKDPPS